MEYSFQLQKLCLFDTKRWYLLILGLVAVTYLMFQSSMLPYGNAIKSLLPNNGVLLGVKNEVLSRGLSVNLERKGETNSGSLEGMKEGNRSDGGVFNRSDIGFEESNRMTQDILSSEGHDQKEALGVNSVEESFLLESGNGGIEKFAELEHQISQNISVELHGGSNSKIIENVERSDQANLELKKGSNIKVNEIVKSGNQANLELAENLKEVPLKDVVVLVNNTKFRSRRRRNKVKPGMPPISVIPIDEMNRRLARHLASSSKMKPQWPSLRDPDMEIIDAKVKIINSPVSPADKELYDPVFRNVSKFIRSYELMEKTLKVYVYKDGRKPIFHQPILKGLYASEGWFMKLMEGNKHFLVKDPEKAHLFYMPFSSRMLEYALYVPGSHNRTKLRQFVKGYTETIAAKYPFWNRSGGADHFVVACHDWALYETRHHMENSIKALCNADVTIGFKIGRDVSLPETFIRYARNPLRELGGKPPSKRNILAFYAGNSHGYLRPTLLKHWEAKDPDMRIYGLLPSSVSRKMNYLQHMKSSKYCICPKGFEVNSPRVVEAIFYECVPVIISDNFVPPLFEVLNWEAFSVIVAEKDIPNLKTILLSIPEAKYMEMQLAVRKVQRHFLWHSRPVKYDLFHMTLHSIWNSRVFQIPRQ